MAARRRIKPNNHNLGTQKIQCQAEAGWERMGKDGAGWPDWVILTQLALFGDLTVLALSIRWTQNRSRGRQRSGIPGQSRLKRNEMGGRDAPRQAAKASAAAASEGDEDRLNRTIPRTRH